MARYDTTPPSKDYEGLSGSSSPFHSADHLPEHISGTVRTRAPSSVSETPEPLFPDSTSSQRKGLSPQLLPYSSSSISIPIQDTQQLDGSSSSSSSISGSKSLRTSSNQSIHVRLLRLTWIVALFMGEYGIYWAMVNRCDWPKNSAWDSSSTRERYRMAIIADPQLTDWFSYGQSGLLLMLVETYTDLYMRRSFRRLHKSLQPDAVLFLGDLNDGGRGSNKDVFDKNTGRFFERIFDTRSSAWNQAPIVQDVEESAVTTDAPYAVNITGRYQQRMDVPLDSLTREWIRTQGKSVRLYVAGNHDVGFGNTLIRPSMVRYKQTFGSVNYEVKVGNHSLVVLDTLALSADTPEIREESQQFLTQLGEETPTLPRILFTHVPLFRLDTTYCGDARETKQLILNRGGEQYWNMVNSSLSQETLHAIRPDMVFSGDDHDWCEIAHPLDGSFTPEVTLPTFSFAQGIQQPGFVMLSLYNPDRKVRNQFPVISTSSPSGLPVSTTHESSGTVARPSTDATFAYEACMLPNQLQIYKVYGLLFGCTLSLILIRRYRWIMRGRRYLEGGPLLEGWKDTSYTDTEPLGSTTATAPQYQQLRQQDWFGDEYVGESPPSPVLTSLDNSYRDGQRNKWSFYWKVVAWDMWHIARFAVPLYLLLFAFTML